MKRILGVWVWVWAAGMAAFFTSVVGAVPPYKAQDAVWARYVTSAAVVNSTAVLVIDLSDTSNFPHRSLKSIDVLSVTIDVDKVAAGTSTVRVGVLTSVNASSGTVNWFAAANNVQNVSNTNLRARYDFGPSSLRAEVVSSDTPYFLSGERTTITPVAGQPLLFQSDIPLFSPRGVSVIPSVGDLVAEIQASATNGSIVDIGVLYISRP